MLKRFVRIATTFGLLIAGYLGYVQAFALLSSQIQTAHNVPVLPYDPAPARSSIEAAQLARDAFGPGHFSHNANIRYYDTAKGYWIYTQNYTRADDGKKIVLEPFALIWRSRHGKPLKTVTADRAVLQFNRAPDMLKGGSKEARLVHARIEGNPSIRDDKGTPANLGDDLTISMLYAEFDEATQTVRSDSAITLRERDAVATGEDLEIALLADPNSKGSVVGYNGAKTIKVKRNVHITVEDVGRSGIVPGGVDQATQDGKERAKRPGEIRCAGELLIELPPPRPEEVASGADPTIAHFSRDVIVRQGDAQAPEQLNCDQLHLTLYPDERGKAKVAKAESESAQSALDSDADVTSRATADGGPISNLVLRHAHATGHAVWLQSTAREAVAFGNELVYRRGTGGEPDVTHFRGDRWTEIRRKNSDQGTQDVIRTTDVTLYHSGSADEAMSIVARGPGWLETRSLEDEKVTRSAKWADQCVMQPVANDPTRRELTLLGKPEVRDTERGYLSAEQKIVASLVAKSKPMAKDDKVGTPKQDASYSIEVMQAWQTVKLVSNETATAAQRTIDARTWLGVVFEKGPEPVPGADVVKEAKPAQQVAAVEKPAAEKTREQSPTPAKPAEPPIIVSADRIWAWVIPAESEPGGKEKEAVAKSPDQEKWDLREVRLRGDVLVHQTPGADKKQGLDVKGQEVDVTALGNKLFMMHAAGEYARPASVVTQDMRIEGLSLGLDQSQDLAWVDGPGKLIQKNSGSGILGDAQIRPTTFVDEKANAASPKPSGQRGPLTIAWGRDVLGAPLPAKDANGRTLKTYMKFHGSTRDERGLSGPAMAEFFTGVRAWTNDAVLTCNDMRAYLDETVDFANTASSRMGSLGTRTAERTNADAAKSRQPQITRVECRDKVDVVLRSFDQNGLLTEKRRVRGEHVDYDRTTNEFHVRSPGVLDLYDRGDQQAGLLQRPRGGVATDNRARMRPVSTTQGKPSAPAPLKLTRVWFDQQMNGQITSTASEAGVQAGQAEFFGKPRMINAIVPDEDTEIDADTLPADGVYAVSDTMRVVSEPPAPGSSSDSGDRVYVQAWGQLYALSKSRGREFAMSASDHMNYNSETGLSYVYGGETGVTIVEQSGVGQQASYARGKTIIYDHKTGEHKLLDAQQISIADLRTGSRAGVPATPPVRKPPKPKRKLYPKLDDSDKERSNFTGR